MRDVVTLREWLDESPLLYRHLASKLGARTRRLPAKSVAALVLFTPQQRWELAVKAWAHWHRTGEVTGGMANARRAYIEAIPGRLRRRLGETTDHWVNRLQLVSGLGLIKAPFLASLLEPLSPGIPVCIDVWMKRLFGLRDTEDSPKVLAQVQRRIQQEAFITGTTPFPVQWAMWDWMRSAKSLDTPPLVVRVTDIERDIQQALNGEEVTQ